jgi:Cys-tRNA(Pro)/Cys-tRNA(Cys) deacylase
VAGRSTPATALLSKLGIAHSVLAYPHDPRHGSYGAVAAQALGVAPEQVFKTLVAEVDGELTIGVVPVAGQLDLKALAAAAGGKKASMAAAAQADRATGYVTGGISPLGPPQADPGRGRLLGAGVPDHLLQRRPARAGTRAGARRPGPGRGRGGRPDRRGAPSLAGLTRGPPG